MINLGYTDNTIPGPHATFRQQYRFPQMTSTPGGEYNVLRPTRKGSGSQFRYLNYRGGPQAAPTQLKWLKGLKGLSCYNLGMLGDHTDTDHATGLPVYRPPVWLQILSSVSFGLSFYHGYRRNRSWGWALGWGLLGGIFPVITPAVAFSQGFAKRKR